MSSGGGQKSKVVAGMIIGMVLGVAAAGFIAWYLVNKNPASFTNKELREPSKAAPQAQSAPVPAPVSSPVAASGVAQPQSFEFYKVLPDKPEGGAASHKQPVVKSQQSAPIAKPLPPQPAAKPADSTLYFVQVGSFQNVDDAEKLKAKLALVGMEASVQKADVPGRGVFHRVRLGPFKGQAEANSTIANLKSNGIENATALHAQ